MPIGLAIGGAAASIGGALISSSGSGKAADAVRDSSAQTDATNRYIYDTTRADYAPYRQVGQGALYKLADMYGVSRPSTTPSGPAALAGGTSWEQAPDSMWGFPQNGPNSGGVVNVWRGLVNPAGVQTTQPTGTTMQPVTPSSGMTAGFDGFQASPGYQFRVDEAQKAIERSAAARGGLRSGATMDALQRRVQGVASDEYENYANRLSALAGVGQSATAGSAQSGQAYANQQSQTNMAAGNARASAYQDQASAWNQGIQGAGSSIAYALGRGGNGGLAPTQYADSPYGALKLYS